MKNPEQARIFDISRFFVAAFTGFLAGHLTNYSVILYAQDVWNSDLMAGLGFGLCFGVPLILGWFGGAWCDSHSPQKVAQWAHVSFLISLCLLSIATKIDPLFSHYVFLLGAVFTGMGWAVLAPARMALLGRLAGTKQAKFAVFFNILIMLGFGTAPLLLVSCKKLGGWEAVHFTGIGLFMVSIFSLFGLKAVGLGHSSSALDRIRIGVGYVAKTPLLKQSIIFSMMVYLSMGPVQVMLPRFTTNILGLTDISRGVFLGAMAFALLVGGGIALPMAKRFGFGKMILLSGIICGYAMMALGLSIHFSISLFFLLLSGVGAGIAISLVVALLQSESKTEYRGRIMSLYTITSQVVPAASGLLSGIVLTKITVDFALAGAGGIMTALLLFAFFKLKDLKVYVAGNP